MNKYLSLTKLSVALGTCIYSSILLAGTMGEIYTPTYRPMISILGGYANIEARNSSTFYDSDNYFIYRSSNNGQDAGVGGVFFGLEYTRTPTMLVQLGLDYSYFGRIPIKGGHSVGVEPATSTLYSYQYGLQAQQLLAAAKLLITMRENYHPYFFVGVGAAFNESNNYRAATAETCGINLTPGFGNHDTTDFSYGLGIGIDYDVNQNVRIGLGYRFSDLGQASLNYGQLESYNGYTSYFPYKLGTHHSYANQFIAQVSYLM